jgi:2-polyprenyl-3-methyl-5-hydroxy-6-metoxy-1,4-benzoquinol methylase
MPLLVAGGLRVIDRTGVLVNPLTRVMRLSNFTGINYMMAAVKIEERHRI